MVAVSGILKKVRSLLPRPLLKASKLAIAAALTLKNTMVATDVAAAMIDPTVMTARIVRIAARIVRPLSGKMTAIRNATSASMSVTIPAPMIRANQVSQASQVNCLAGNVAAVPETVVAHASVTPACWTSTMH